MPENAQVHHEVGGEGPAAKAERLSKEKAAAVEQAEAAKADEATEPAVSKRTR